ncbi:MAG: hypothetical protein HY924_08590 [Elusimicrobia bacterium]|nr:hypothetical protein [Elusimicrobiota bacterium]
MRLSLSAGLTLVLAATAPAPCAADECGPSGCECKGPNCGPAPSYQPAPSFQPRPTPAAAVPASPLDAADRLFAQGRFQEAETKYYEAQKALLWSPGKCKADMGLGRTYLKLGNPQSALFWFRSANENGCPEGGPEARKLEQALPPPKPLEEPKNLPGPDEPAFDYNKMTRAMVEARKSGDSAAAALFDALSALAKPHLTSGGPPKEFSFTFPALERYSKGSPGPAVVDLRGIPLDEALTLDPRVPQGRLSAGELKAQDTAFERLCDADEAIAVKDWAGMMRQLRAALKARPGDEDIRKSVSIRMAYRDLKTAKIQGSARTTALLDSLELAQGDWGMSLSYLREEALADPGEPGKRDAFSFLQGWAMGTAALPGRGEDLPPGPPPPEVPAADELVRRAMSAMGAERLELYRQAQRLSPHDQAIRDLVNFFEGSALAEGWKEAAGGAP